MTSPQFRVVVEEEGKIIFFYAPGKKERLGLAPLLVGLLRGVAEIQFGIAVLNITQLKLHDDGTYEYLVTWDDDSSYHVLTPPIVWRAFRSRVFWFRCTFADFDAAYR